MKTRKIQCALLAVVMAIGLSPSALSAGKAENSVKGRLLKKSVSEKQMGEATKVGFEFDSIDTMLQSMKKVSENEKFSLYYNASNLSVALQEKASGRVYTTNPYNASLDDDSVGNTEKILESQVVLTYLDINERQQKLEMYSSSDCVELGQFAYTECQNGVSFALTVGKTATQSFVPPAMSEALFQRIIEKLEGRPARRMGVFYTRYSLEDELSEEERSSLISRYPGIKNGAVYAALDLSERETEEVEKYIKQSGCTAEEIKKDMKSIGAKTEENHSPSFAFELEYVLTDDGMTVNIPNESIAYDETRYQLLSVKLLPFFGSDLPKEGGEGYLFFPDGSGSVIQMDGQSENRRPLMTVPVYGFDAANEMNVDTRSGETCHLPVFGIHRNDAGSMLGIIESGDEVASVVAQLGRPNGSYYTVYPSFTLANDKHVQRDAKVSSLGSKQMIYLFEKGRTPYSGNITVSYHILPENQNGYVGMAAKYRSYLMQKGMSENKKVRAGIAVETLGTALYPKDFLGFTVQSQAKLTTYDQNIEILKELKNAGVQDITLRMTGWQKYGLDVGNTRKVKLSNALGGKKAFRQLLAYTKQENVLFYPDVDLLFVGVNRLFDGFSANTDGIRQLDYTMGGIADYQPDIDDFGDLRIGISPNQYAKQFDSFFKSASAYDLTALSLGSIGTYLNSDYSRKNTYNRGDTRKTLESLLIKYGKDRALSFNGANAYVLPYADSLYGVSMTDSHYLGESYSVPFIQLVVSGCVQVQSAPINLQENMTHNILRCIETGTVPSFVVCYDNVRLLKQTAYSQYFSVAFAVQKQHILEAYRKFSEVAKASNGSRMVAHRRVADGVFVSVYENGAEIYVNYNNNEYVTDKITVAAESFAVVAR